MKYERLKENLNVMCMHNHTQGSKGRVIELTNGRKTESQVIDEIVTDCREILDKIEQGTLIELPCKVGDTIWGIYEFADEEDDCYEIYPVRVREIHIRKDDIWLEIERPFIGKFVSEKICFTREEAEKRLEELQNEHKSKM